MLILYKILVNLLYMIAWPVLKIKQLSDGAEWSQRRALKADDYLNLNTNTDSGNHLWFHASSVGEVRALSKLVVAMMEKRPDLVYSVSTFTTAGNTVAKGIFPDARAIFYFPLDCHFPLRRLFRKFRPTGIVIVETEIWPYFLSCCKRYRIPLLLANGRLSEKSFKHYRLFSKSLVSLFEPYRKFVMQSQADAERIVSLGAANERVVVAGNMKYDPVSGSDREKKREAVRKRLGLKEDEVFVVAASTRPGEEEILCRALKNTTHFPDKITVLMAPRHLKRLEEVVTILDYNKIAHILYSDFVSGQRNDSSLILMDQIGLLADLFYGADIAFVGGTLADLGGHNVMEPALAGVPVIFGPSLFNVQEAADAMVCKNQAMIVRTADDISSILEKFIAGEVSFQAVTEDTIPAAPATAAIVIEEFGL